MGIKSTEDYHRVLKYFPPMEEPSFESEEMMEFVWGRRWGCNSEVGRLKTVLMRRPDHEMDVITMDKWDDEIGAIMGENHSWYWRCDRQPNLAHQHPSKRRRRGNLSGGRAAGSRHPVYQHP